MMPAPTMAKAARAALTLLRSGLSAKGFTEVDTILHLEEVLFAIEGSAIRDPELYADKRS